MFGSYLFRNVFFSNERQKRSESEGKGSEEEYGGTIIRIFYKIKQSIYNKSGKIKCQKYCFVTSSNYFHLS